MILYTDVFTKGRQAATFLKVSELGAYRWSKMSRCVELFEDIKLFPAGRGIMRFEITDPKNRD